MDVSSKKTAMNAGFFFLFTFLLLLLLFFIYFFNCFSKDHLHVMQRIAERKRGKNELNLLQRSECWQFIAKASNTRLSIHGNKL